MHGQLSEMGRANREKKFGVVSVFAGPRELFHRCRGAWENRGDPLFLKTPFRRKKK